MTGDQAKAVAAEKDTKTGRFLPGNSGFGGRPKGSRNRLGEEFIKALSDDFDANGVSAIARVREERPQDYLKVIASLLPKEIKLSDERELSDEELDRQLRELATVLGNYLGPDFAVFQAASGTAEASAH